MKKFLLTFVLAVGSILLFQSCREDGDHSNLSENGLLIEQTPSAEIIVNNYFSQKYRGVVISSPIYANSFEGIKKMMKIRPIEGNTITKIEYHVNFNTSYNNGRGDLYKEFEYTIVDDFSKSPKTEIIYTNTLHKVDTKIIQNANEIRNFPTYKDGKVKVLIFLSKGNTIIKELNANIKVNQQDVDLNDIKHLL